MICCKCRVILMAQNSNQHGTPCYYPIHSDPKATHDISGSEFKNDFHARSIINALPEPALMVYNPINSPLLFSILFSD